MFKQKKNVVSYFARLVLKIFLLKLDEEEEG